jgi:hypothetical protein
VRKLLEKDIKLLKDKKEEIRDDLKYYRKYTPTWVSLREKREDINKRIKKLEKILSPYLKTIEKESIYVKE